MPSENKYDCIPSFFTNFVSLCTHNYLVCFTLFWFQLLFDQDVFSLQIVFYTWNCSRIVYYISLMKKIAWTNLFGNGIMTKPSDIYKINKDKRRNDSNQLFCNMMGLSHTPDCWKKWRIYTPKDVFKAEMVTIGLVIFRNSFRNVKLLNTEWVDQVTNSHTHFWYWGLGLWIDRNWEIFFLA